MALRCSLLSVIFFLLLAICSVQTAKIVTKRSNHNGVDGHVQFGRDQNAAEGALKRSHAQTIAGGDHQQQGFRQLELQNRPRKWLRVSNRVVEARASVNAVFPGRWAGTNDLNVGFAYDSRAGSQMLFNNRQIQLNAKKLQNAAEQPPYLKDIKDLFTLCMGLPNELGMFNPIPDRNYNMEWFSEEKLEKENLIKDLKQEAEKGDLQTLLRTSTYAGIELGMPMASVAVAGCLKSRSWYRRLLGHLLAPARQLLSWVLAYCPYDLGNPRILVDFVVKVTDQDSITVSLDFQPKDKLMFVVVKNETGHKKHTTIVRISEDPKLEEEEISEKQQQQKLKTYSVQMVELGTQGQKTKAMADENMRLLQVLQKCVKTAVANVLKENRLDWKKMLARVIWDRLVGEKVQVDKLFAQNNFMVAMGLDLEGVSEIAEAEIAAEMEEGGKGEEEKMQAIGHLDPSHA